MKQTLMNHTSGSADTGSVEYIAQRSSFRLKLKANIIWIREIPAVHTV